MTNNGNGETDFSDREHEKFSSLSVKIAYILIGLGFLIFGILLFNTVNDMQDTQNRLKLEIKRQNVADERLQTLAASNRALILRQEQFVDQSCRANEREHRREVENLIDTYAFLKELPADERTVGINKFILRNLPETERRAARDVAPKRCDELGMGLAEPDPCVPGRPEFLGGDGKPVVGPPCRPVRRPPDRPQS